MGRLRHRSQGLFHDRMMAPDLQYGDFPEFHLPLAMPVDLDNVPDTGGLPLKQSGPHRLQDYGIRAGKDQVFDPYVL